MNHGSDWNPWFQPQNHLLQLILMDCGYVTGFFVACIGIQESDSCL